METRGLKWIKKYDSQLKTNLDLFQYTKARKAKRPATMMTLWVYGMGQENSHSIGRPTSSCSPWLYLDWTVVFTTKLDDSDTTGGIATCPVAMKPWVLTDIYPCS